MEYLKNRKKLPAGEVGERLKEFRLFIGRPSDRMAREFDWPVRQLRKIEEGKVLPPLTYLTALSETYNLDINWLLTGVPLVHEAGEKKGAPPPQQVKEICLERHIPYKEAYDDLLETLQVPEAAERMVAALDDWKRIFKDEIAEFFEKHRKKKSRRAR